MLDMQVTLELLFEQLGLASHEAEIEAFIEDHQLDRHMPLHDAPFWTESQQNFILSHWKKDDEWAMIVDRLNALLHSQDGTADS